VTLVIAHRDGWMAADRRTVFEDCLIGPYRLSKIKRGRRLLVACAGNGVFADFVQEALAPSPSDELRAVAQVFRDKGSDIGGHALALTPAGICELTSKGGIVWLDADFWAIGSGYPFALGWLSAIAAHRRVAEQDALHAINFVATRVNNVGDGYQIERLEPKEVE
jgi:ATP-dependent protease HslVU (ClpYQ) peptidase subunit